MEKIRNKAIYLPILDVCKLATIKEKKDVCLISIDEVVK